MVAIHMRHGDTVFEQCCDEDGREAVSVQANYRSEHRVISESAYLQLIEQMHLNMSEAARRRLHYTLYSEGELDHFRSFRLGFKEKTGFPLNVDERTGDGRI